jgi:predicted amidohydrolase YtcJ
MRRLVNAAVFTGDRSALWVDAVALDGDAVVAAGSLDAVRDASPGAEEVDFAGCTVLPGLIDAHNHFLATGESLAAVDVRTLGATSRRHLIDAVADAAARTELGGLITGFGFDPSKYPDGAPDRRDLDAAAPQHRVLIYHVSGHGALVSSAVLGAAGVTRDTGDPEGGRFVRDAAGELTGLCFDSALHVLVPVEVDIGQHGPNFHVAATADELRAAVLRAQSAFVAAGLTTVCDAQVTSREMTAYQGVHRSGDLAIRTVCMPLSHQLDQLLEVGVSSGFGDDRLHLGPMKFYADGTLLGGTALLAESYGCDHTGNGHLFRPMADIRRDLVRAAAAGWRVGVHAQGDEAIAQLLPALEEAAAVHPRSDLRPRIEHAGLPPEGSLRRLAAIGAIAVSQPSYLYEMGDQFLSDLGERAHLLQPWRDELDADVRVCLSSDSDVASYRPLHTIAAALDRTSAGGAVLGRRHQLSLDEALFAHTAVAAYAIGREHDLGALTPGRRADVTVVEGDLRHVSPAEIRGLSVRATMIDGVWVHGAG